MANEIKRMGRNTVLFVYTPIKNKAGTVVAEDYYPIGCLTTNDLTKTNNTNDGTITKCDINPLPTYTNQTYQLTWEAVSIEDDGEKATSIDLSKLQDDSINNNDPIFWKQETKNSDNTVTTRFGKALFTEFSESFPADGEATYSGTFLGSGSISETDLNV